MDASTATVLDAAPVLDAAQTQDIGEISPLAPGDYAVASLRSGERFHGEVIAIYDRSVWWWTPQDERLYALFDSETYNADYLRDRSVTIAASSEIESLVHVGAPIGAVRFEAFMREQSFVWARVPLDGVVYVLNGHESYHLQEDGYGDFAWDLSRTDAKGSRYAGSGDHNDDYLIWHEPVVSPAAGVIVELVRDAPDNSPGAYPDGAVNNLIGIALGGAYYLYLLHFAEASIPEELVVGSRVETGTLLGLVGNSGVSLEPHLHITALYYDSRAASPRTYSIPSEFRDAHVASTGKAILSAYSAPLTGQYISNEPF